MKRFFIFILSVFICSNVFAIEAKVLSVTGKVQVQKGAAWVDLRPGDLVKKGDLIQTGFKSEAQISITSGNENSKMTIQQLSRITIEQLAENSTGDKTSVYLATGSVKSEIKKTEDRRANYTVRGPVATASVRGTILNVRNTFGGAIIGADDGIVAAWRTHDMVRSPSISTKDDDVNFNIATSGTDSAQGVSALSPQGSFTVEKGQTADFTEYKLLTSSEKAIANALKLKGITLMALEFEADYNMNDTNYYKQSAGSSSLSIDITYIPIQ